MPVYDYKCKDCNKVSEIFVRRFGGELEKCPNCDSPNLEKVTTFDAHFYLGGSKALPKRRKMF